MVSAALPSRPLVPPRGPSGRSPSAFGRCRAGVGARADRFAPAGPIRLLTLLRNWGYYFNPLSLYYCFAGTPEVEAVVAEVSNTPWRERHWYVLWPGNRIGEPSQLKFRHPKDFHVSPFLDLDFVYEWQLSVPREQLNVALATLRGEERVFDASFSLKRRKLTRGNMLHTLAVSVDDSATWSRPSTGKRFACGGRNVRSIPIRSTVSERRPRHHDGRCEQRRPGIPVERESDHPRCAAWCGTGWRGQRTRFLAGR